MEPTTSPPTPPLLRRVGSWCHDHRWSVIAGWLIALLVLGGAVRSVGSGFTTEFSLPDVESSRGFDLLEEHFGGRGAGINGTVVFEATQGVRDATVEASMTELFAAIAATDIVSGVQIESPYGEQGGRQISPEGTIAFANVELPDGVSNEKGIALRDMIEEAAPDIDGLRIELGGQIFSELEPPESEVLGLGFAIVILILAFGSVIAMGLPIATAIAGIVVGLLITTLLSNLLEMPGFTSTMAAMIGLGVGIDYALFIVTRFREELHLGKDSGEAAATAINTAGRAVLFAGVTVVVSLLGLLLIGLSFTQGLGIGAASVVAVTMIASVTLLPALLGFVGTNVERTRWRGLIAAGLVAVALIGVGLSVQVLVFGLPLAVMVLVVGTFVSPLKDALPVRRQKPLDQTLAYRWSRVIQRRPWPALLAGSIGLLILTLPVVSLRLGFSDAGNLPKGETTREAYDLLSKGFGPGFNGPLLLVTEVPGDTDPSVIPGISERLAATDGVAFASPAVPNNFLSPTAVQWFVIPASAPQDAATERLVNHIRHDLLPEATAGSELDVAVTGPVAADVDFSQYLAKRMLVFFAAVLVLSFLLLMTVFRSLLVPLKAVLMNLISIGAAYGVAVAVFQWGWGASLLGVDQTGPIEPFIPMMLFAVVFGLSMDYEVFLLSRIKEEYDRGSSNARAVADGLASTARVITAAAAIMVFVFGSFLLENDRIIKLFGLGLASAVLLDATVVRMLLVPATMELLGDRNWWLPRWLDRLLPRIQIEGDVHDPVVDSDENGLPLANEAEPTSVD